MYASARFTPRASTPSISCRAHVQWEQGEVSSESRGEVHSQHMACAALVRPLHKVSPTGQQPHTWPQPVAASDPTLQVDSNASALSDTRSRLSILPARAGGGVHYLVIASCWQGAQFPKPQKLSKAGSKSHFWTAT